MTGWHAANFRGAGQKLKNLDHYLKPPAPPEKKRDKGAQEVLMMFKRVAKKKGKKDGV